jgi:hypothetical protein
MAQGRGPQALAGRISELSHVKPGCHLVIKWDPGAASARGAADGRGGEVPPPDPQTRGLKLSAVSYCKGCASRRGLVIPYIVYSC